MNTVNNNSNNNNSNIARLIESVGVVVTTIVWTIAWGFITFGEGPGHSLGNLYFSTWAAFIISILITADCFHDCMVNNRIISSMKSVFLSGMTTTTEEQQQQHQGHHQIELPSSSATIATGDINDFDNNDDI
ncbi:hypothetical protein FRACYDRAFT_269700 [Fragilariopsis cylindrus CCMP1102]|uniref:Uncharacterized protein n=1 Tax=Fragilariopsis cylindrus CCMP1102 TaxID=635003 RepID=A0A1E7F9Q2_9STRA|nr:hypothetical protein FRACYDRAFT_269700 [Fragilariopsis cylindrus CCMP1102]|eukprot:OEU14864.1 hypothetical protein FRACYDRAFT_269700 [Fragilariopsis cylindrus CCMP1102]